MKTTKNLWGLLSFMMVAMLCVGFISCNKEDSYSTSVNVSDLVGTWDCTESTDYWDGGSKEGALVGKYIIIESNGTYNSNSSTVYSGSYTLSGNTLTVRSNKGRKFTATVSINKTKGTMLLEGSTDDGYTFSYKFKKRY